MMTKPQNTDLSGRQVFWALAPVIAFFVSLFVLSVAPFWGAVMLVPLFGGATIWWIRRPREEKQREAELLA
jgi:hypothetical protein